jgi:hypothetical protein
MEMALMEDDSRGTDVSGRFEAGRALIFSTNR